MLSTLWRRLSNGLTQNATAAYFRACTRSFYPCACAGPIPKYGMNVCVIPAPQTGGANVMYLVVDGYTKEAAVVDPIEPKCVLKIVKQQNLNLTQVLITHWHCDHQGGNFELAKLHKGDTLTFYGRDPRISGLTDCVYHNKTIRIGRLVVTCLVVPCHTSGDVAYFIEDPCGVRALFSGDVLFLGGVGPLSEGTAAQLYNALKIFKSLPDNTAVYGGHDLAVENLKFARIVEPENWHVSKRLHEAKDHLYNQKPGYPSTIKQENMWNPFMRYHVPAVQNFVGAEGGDPVTVLHKLVEAKAGFNSRLGTFS